MSSSGVDIFGVRDLILALVAFLSGGMMWLIKMAFKQAVDNLQQKIDTLEEKIENEKKTSYEKYSNINEKFSNWTNSKENLIAKREEVAQSIEKQIIELKLHIAGKYSTKEDCYKGETELKLLVSKLEQSMKDLDRVAREQGEILTRIDTALQALL